eukprot:220219_1
MSITGCDWYNTHEDNPKYWCMVDAYYYCGWCVNYLNTTINKCISVDNYCQNKSLCVEFDTNESCDNYDPAEALLIMLMTFLLICTNAVCIGLTMTLFEPIQKRYNIHDAIIIICGLIPCLFAMVISLCELMYYPNKTVHHLYQYSALIAAFLPLALAILTTALFKLVELLKHINQFGRSVGNKGWLILVVVIIYLLFAFLFITPLIQLWEEFQYIDAITFVSLLLLWVDLRDLALHIQTDESKLVFQGLCSKSATSDNKYAVINEDEKHDHEEHIIDRSVQCFVLELLCFGLYIITFVCLALSFEELEPCFMNCATIGACMVHMIIWVRHNKFGSTSRLIIIGMWSLMFGFTIFSCACVDECVWSHMAVVMLGFAWSSGTITQKMLCSKI